LGSLPIDEATGSAAMTVGSEILEALAAAGTATVSTQLIKRGLRRHWIAGAKPLLGAARLAGPAFTFRFIPGREDVSTFEDLTRPGGLAAAIEAVPAGAVLVCEAGGAADSGLLGDILCERLKRRGARALVSDGVMRDLAGLREVGWPIWCAGIAPPAAVQSLWFAGFDLPVGCGGVAVFPGDILVADADGVVVVPHDQAEAVAAAAAEQDAFERWIIAEVRAGRPVAGFYPPTEATRVEYRELHTKKRR
jgi:regulator of RNase E activity RraA